MSDTADVNNFTGNDVVSLTGTSFASGLFNFTNSLTAGGHFFLISPQIRSLQPVGGRWGQLFPVHSSKYKHLTVRANYSSSESDSYGLRVLWFRGKLDDSTAERTITKTGLVPTFSGFRNYSLDLSILNTGNLESNVPGPPLWTSAQLTGFGLYPMVELNSAQIDYIRLEDPTTCGSTVVNYNSLSLGNDDLVSFYLDDDSNVSNGFLKKLLSSANSTGSAGISVSSLTLQPGTYKVTAKLHSDYATLERDNPWDMNESTDLSLIGDVSGGTFGGGTYSGTSSGASPNLYFNIPASTLIDSAKYKKISLKISRSVSDDMQLFWENSTGTSGAKLITNAGNDPDANSVYEIDMLGEGSWTGDIKTLILRLATSTPSGVTFSLDFLQLRKTGYVASESQGSSYASSGNLVVAAPPTLQILQPDKMGGELYRANSMNVGDMGFSLNADSTTDSSNPNESLTAYLPDVRSIAGVRGDIYKASNRAGNDDPNEYLTFPSIGNNRYTIDADEYTNLCIKMSLNRDYDLGLGSVTKFFYKKTDSEFQEADAWATIYDRWSSSRWYEYCLDATTHPTEIDTFTWGGILEAFRVDPHEFHLDTCCDNTGNPTGNPIQVTTYYDYIRLAKRDRSYGKFALAYQVQDSDTTTPTVSWSYSTTKDFVSSTTIPNGSLTCDGRVCIWNTSAVTNGDYYVKATATDGINSNPAISSGVLSIKNGQGVTDVAPILVLENPANGRILCSDMQVKGYAVNNAINEPVVAVQVFIDNIFQQLVVPNQYSPASKTAYPERISETGFNFTLPVTTLSSGAHTVLIKAYSSNGGTASSSISVTKQNSCTDVITEDTAPAGSPVAGDVVGGSPTATPAPTTPSKPTILKASLSNKGALAVDFSGVTSSVSGCSINLLAGDKPNTLSAVKLFPITPSDVTHKKFSLKGSGIKINKKKISKLYIAAKYTCYGSSSAAASKTISVKTSGPLVTIKAVIKSLAGKLKKS
jgi:hypothetical protein